MVKHHMIHLYNIKEKIQKRNKVKKYSVKTADNVFWQYLNAEMIFFCNQADKLL